MSYKAPKKEDYPKRKKPEEYLCSHQPLPRSTYGREFLTYGNLPKFNYKQGCSQIVPSGSKKPQKSSYETDFTAKKPDLTNFRELDCYKDKFKYFANNPET